jgi:tRNA modification GTPase
MPWLVRTRRLSPPFRAPRDVVERPIAVDGTAFVLVDTAGVRALANDPIEAIGIARAEAEFTRADIVLWLGPEGEGPPEALEVSPKADLPGPAKSAPMAVVSAKTAEGIAELWAALVARARTLLPVPGEVALNRRQRAELASALDELMGAASVSPLIAAERLRLARVRFDTVTGCASTEDMLDALFGRFCIGK